MFKMFTDALVAAGAQNAESIRDAMTAQAQKMRGREDSYTTGVGYPAKSVYSHADGDEAHPRTKFRCPMFMGVVDGKGITTPAFEIFQDVCTEAERIAYNALVPGKYRVQRNDGAEANWHVVEEQDDLGETIRVIVAVPLPWLKKDAQAQMPSQKSFLKQLTEAVAA
jgi:hypothetical protein